MYACAFSKYRMASKDVAQGLNSRLNKTGIRLTSHSHTSVGR